MTQKRLTLGRFGNPIYLGNTQICFNLRQSGGYNLCEVQ
jgi:hypothetical protein